MGTKLTKGELQEYARQNYLDPDQSYEELREEIDILTCKMCGDEYLYDLWDGFCTDGCQVRYINEYY